MKKIVKEFLPSFILSHLKSFLSPWQGDFSSWDEALRQSKGYDDKEILQKVALATSKVVSGKKPYERDSVLFDEVLYSWPLVSALLNTFITQKRLDVIDFGGSLGSTFYQNKYFLSKLPTLTWSIVEQEQFVIEGSKKFSTEQLNFYKSLEEAFEKHKSNFVLISSVLQYIPEPYEILRKLISLEPDVIFLDRLSIVDAKRDIITLQTVPAKIYSASYPCRFFYEPNVISLLDEKYDLVSRFDCFIENQGVLNHKYAFKDIGQYWVRKDKV